MDSIIGRLSEVESAAAAIVEHAEAQKALLDEKMKKKREDFERETTAETERKIAEIREKMERDMTSELERLKRENADALNAYRQEYEREHEAYAQEIIKRITEV